jgi:hypothetical protein
MEKSFRSEVELLRLGSGSVFHGEGILAITNGGSRAKHLVAFSATSPWRYLALERREENTPLLPEEGCRRSRRGGGRLPEEGWQRS